MGARPNIRRIQLGKVLRELRDGANLTLHEAAPLLDWSASKLSRIEHGAQAIDVHGVRSMLDLYNAAERWDEILEMTRQARQRGWWWAYGLNDRGYVPLEAEATLVRDYALACVPGLLQTEEYARALFEGALLDRARVNLANEIKVRMIRQTRLHSADDPLELVAIVDESVLHRPVGGPAVMRDQLRHLLKAAAFERVTFQVLPTAAGARPALSGIFSLLSFDSLGIPDLVYLEHPVGAIQLEKAEEVAQATLVFDQLRSLALSPADSVELLRRAAERT
jgi:transcriptional regulator with XRE-family HTH domain